MMDERVRDFVASGSWFERQYKPKLGERYPTLKLALNLWLQHQGRTIVETGTLRWVESLAHGWEGDGNATYLFGALLARFGGHLWTCDINPMAVEEARRGTQPFAAHITYVCEDSVAFLRGFAQPIDLLYLDSLDCPDTGDAAAAQRHALAELQAALPHLAPQGIVLLDDNWQPNGGKTRLAKQHLAQLGWLCLYDARQTLWLRG